MEMLHLGKEIVNMEHIIRVKYWEPTPGGVEEYNAETGEKEISSPTSAKLVLTLAALELEECSADYSDFHLAAASRSQTVVVRDRLAMELWRYLTLRSVIVEEWTDEQQADDESELVTTAWPEDD